MEQPVTRFQTECPEEERISPFLAGWLEPERRQGFIAHLAVCKDCADLLRDLREDERLARIPLTREERKAIERIVETGRTDIQEQLEGDRQQREQERAARPPLRRQYAAPELVLVTGGRFRVLGWSLLAAASLTIVVGWLLWN